jgi:uncharacterized protein YndB with AHSA1/START domain
MRPVRASIEIAAPVNTVWPLLAEFRWWPSWGPTVRAVVADATSVAPGTRGRIQTPIGMWVPFEITNVEPERSWNWTVAGIRATGHHVTALDPGRTRVDFTVSGWLAPYAVVLNAGLRNLKRLAEMS